mmetsp:Transcript_6327/g.18803  ORF Transcript_6327/g.18803 Transcript_6327/m.18803 type:complete len:235 (+) Transcript_6327:4025-4729(+)
MPPRRGTQCARVCSTSPRVTTSWCRARPARARWRGRWRPTRTWRRSSRPSSTWRRPVWACRFCWARCATRPSGIQWTTASMPSAWASRRLSRALMSLSCWWSMRGVPARVHRQCRHNPRISSWSPGTRARRKSVICRGGDRSNTTPSPQSTAWQGEARPSASRRAEHRQCTIGGFSGTAPGCQTSWASSRRVCAWHRRRLPRRVTCSARASTLRTCSPRAGDTAAAPAAASRPT